jgi:three-Cys-motif partner protein
MAKRSKFFSQQTEASRVKAEIIAKYFPGWARVIKSWAKNKMAYVDMYAGRGRFDDGSESTPLLVLRHAIADPVVSQMLVPIFNDKDHADDLRAEIDRLPGLERLKYEPAVYANAVGDDTAKIFQKNLVPTLALLDPWGYKGLTRDLIQSLLKDYGCDLIFFFNYNRINMAITNKSVGKHMEALFGPAWLASLREAVPGLRPIARRRVILAALKRGLKEIGAEYVRPFRFLKTDGRTSHYLIFVTKDFKGVEIMKEVMAGMSSRHVDEVASFSYDPRAVDDTQPQLLSDTSPIDELADRLLTDFAGTKVTVRHIFEPHSGDSRFIERNYKEALRRLEADGRVAADPLRQRGSGAIGR